MSEPSRQPILCFAINLVSDELRRNAISSQLEKLGIPYKVFNAIDGRKIPDTELPNLYDRQGAIKESHDLTRGELGCALSHLGVYREMVENSLNYALIVEDDAKLASDLPAVLKRLAEEFAPDAPVVVLLNYVEKYKDLGVKELDEVHALVNTYGGIPNAHGYFITLAAARNLSENLFPIRLVADRWDKFNDKGLIKVKAVVPYCVGLTDFALQSNLDVDRVARMRLYRRGGVRYFLHRFLYKKFIYQLFVRPFQRVKTQKETW
jgi:glycosyl transferase family 25